MNHCTCKNCVIRPFDEEVVENEAVEAEVGDDLLTAHEQVWEESEEIGVDEGLTKLETSIKGFENNLNAVRTPLQCFKFAFPMNRLQTYVEETNAYISTLPAEQRFQSHITAQDLLKYFAIRLYHCLDAPTVAIKDCWAVDPDEYSFERAPNYGSLFNMSRNKFQFITSVFRITRFNDKDLELVRIYYLFCENFIG